MNSEIKHQLYGGDISDYMSPMYEQRSFEDPQHTDKNLANIYDTQIKGQPSIDTTGLTAAGTAGISIPRQRDPHFDVLDAQLRNTLNAIAQQIGLTSDNAPSNNVSVNIKNQTQTDIEAANNNVLQALRELKDLKAI